jgi:hypothetical protein
MSSLLVSPLILHLAVRMIILDVVCLDGPMTIGALALRVRGCTRGEERRRVPGRNGI